MARPRDDIEVMRDIEEGRMPPEMMESLQIPDQNTPEIRAAHDYVRAIVDRLLIQNGYDPASYPLNIMISADRRLNACIATHGRPAQLVVNVGLLQQVRSVDELAGVLGHELGHYIVRSNATETIQNVTKQEETAADLLGTKLIEDAGYNPRALMDLFQRLGPDNVNLITVGSVRQSIRDGHESGDYQAATDQVDRIVDPHPSETNRIRSIENALVGLERERGRIGLDRRPTPIDRNIIRGLDRVEFRTPLRLELEREGFFNAEPIRQMDILTRVLQDNYPPYSRAAANRLSEIGRYIQSIDVDLRNNRPARDAFIRMTDTFTSSDAYNRDRQIVFPSDSRPGTSITDPLSRASTDVWMRGNNIRMPFGMDRRNAHTWVRGNVFVGAMDDLRVAVEGFHNATNAEEARVHAARIRELATRYQGSLLDNSYRIFDFPNEAAVQRAIARDGHFEPSYTRHVQWMNDIASPDIAFALEALSVSRDPWAAAQIREYLPAATSRWDRPQLSNDNISGFRRGYGEFERDFTNIQRDGQGRLTGFIEPEPNFDWRRIDRDAPMEQIVRHETGEARRFEEWQRRGVEIADWDLMRTNLDQFIYRYRQYMGPRHTPVGVEYPFAERFFSELGQILPTASEAYRRQVNAFFGDYQDTSGLSYMELICNSFDRAPYAMYDGIGDSISAMGPHILTQDHPLIRFFREEPGRSMIPDANKFIYLEGFSNYRERQAYADRAYVGHLASPPSTYVEYTPPANIQGLLDLIARPTVPAVILTEWERIVGEPGRQYTNQDMVVLDLIRKTYSGEQLQIGQAAFDRLKREHMQRIMQTGSAQELVDAYRVFQAGGIFSNIEAIKREYVQVMEQRISEVADPAQRLALYRTLLETDSIPLEYTLPDELSRSSRANNIQYDGHVDHPEARQRMVDAYARDLATIIGTDDGSPEYMARALVEVDRIIGRSSNMSRSMLLSAVAHELNAQPELARHLRNQYMASGNSSLMAQGAGGILTELAFNETGADPEMRARIIDFLRAPLTEDSSGRLADYMLSRVDNRFQRSADRSRSGVVLQMENFHRSFWMAPLEGRAVYLERLVFPAHESIDNQHREIARILTDTFPDSGTEEDRANNRYARQIVDAYFDAVDVPERRLLVGAIMAAGVQSEDNTVRVGQRLNNILGAMGPAGAKLLQAIHSHPSTPEPIRADLSDAKVMHNRPERWDYVDWVERAGLTSPDHPNRVTHIGRVIGAGSFGVTSIDTREDGSLTAETMLRPNAGARADREFSIMLQAADTLGAQDDSFSPIRSMVEEAARSSRIETSMPLAARQGQMAAGVYDGITVDVVQDGTSFRFTHVATDATIAGTDGSGYKTASVAQGLHFNELPTATPEQRAYRTAVAQAMIVGHLSARLAGLPVDRDRHGGNIKIEGNRIYHFDYGAMELMPPSVEDRRALGRVLARTVRDSMSGRDFSSAIIANIDSIEVSEQTRAFLGGFKREVLALGDYLSAIPEAQRPAMLATIFSSDTIDPVIREAIQGELGMMRPVVEAGMRTFAAQSGIELSGIRAVSDLPNITLTPDEAALFRPSDSYQPATNRGSQGDFSSFAPSEPQPDVEFRPTIVPEAELEIRQTIVADAQQDVPDVRPDVAEVIVEEGDTAAPRVVPVLDMSDPILIEPSDIGPVDLTMPSDRVNPVADVDVSDRTAPALRLLTDADGQITGIARVDGDVSPSLTDILSQPDVRMSPVAGSVVQDITLTIDGREVRVGYDLATDTPTFITDVATGRVEHIAAMPGRGPSAPGGRLAVLGGVLQGLSTPGMIGQLGSDRGLTTAFAAGSGSAVMDIAQARTATAAFLAEGDDAALLASRSAVLGRLATGLGALSVAGLGWSSWDAHQRGDHEVANMMMWQTAAAGGGMVAGMGTAAVLGASSWAGPAGFVVGYSVASLPAMYRHWEEEDFALSAMPGAVADGLAEPALAIGILIDQQAAADQARWQESIRDTMTNAELRIHLEYSLRDSDQRSRSVREAEAQQRARAGDRSTFDQRAAASDRTIGAAIGLNPMPEDSPVMQMIRDQYIADPAGRQAWLRANGGGEIPAEYRNNPQLASYYYAERAAGIMLNQLRREGVQALSSGNDYGLGVPTPAQFQQAGLTEGQLQGWADRWYSPADQDAAGGPRFRDARNVLRGLPRISDRAGDVRAYQRSNTPAEVDAAALQLLGVANAESLPEGWALTQATVRHLQQQRDLPVTGRLDAATVRDIQQATGRSWEVMREHGPLSDQWEAEETRLAERAAVRQIQAAIGIPDAQQDGVFGQQSQEALRELLLLANGGDEARTDQELRRTMARGNEGLIETVQGLYPRIARERSRTIQEAAGLPEEQRDGYIGPQTINFIRDNLGVDVTSEVRNNNLTPAGEQMVREALLERGRQEFVAAEAAARALYSPEALAELLGDAEVLPAGWVLSQQGIAAIESAVNSADADGVLSADELHAFQQLVGPEHVATLMQTGPINPALLPIINEALAAQGRPEFGSELGEVAEVDDSAIAEQLLAQVTPDQRPELLLAVQGLAGALSGVTLGNDTRAARDIIADGNLESADIQLILQYLRENPSILNGTSLENLADDGNTALMLGDLQAAIVRIQSREQDTAPGL
jgi:hypothetical protein